MSVSLPSNKLLEIQHWTHSLLHRQSVKGHQVIYFLGKTTLGPIGQAQLCH